MVAGAPAKILKYRFDSKKQEKIEASEWWLKDKYSNLKNFLEK
ncbi:hypothetical protein VIH_002830 [Vibrio cholerae CT 5369-93]|nr:hypothetical protein VIH_002830 [Vibrio cholerae CT 5369-93]